MFLSYLLNLNDAKKKSKIFVVFILISSALFIKIYAQGNNKKLDSAFSKVINKEVNSEMTTDSVYNTSYITEKGEKIQRLVIVLDTTQQAAWKSFTDPDQIKTWMVPVVRLDFRIGGKLQTNYNKNAKIGDEGTITQDLLNYMPLKMINFNINLTKAFPEKCRREDGPLQYIVKFDSLSYNRTRLTFSMFGWGKGKEWDAVYEKFLKGNIWTFKNLIKRVRSGPIDWE